MILKILFKLIFILTIFFNCSILYAKNSIAIKVDGSIITDYDIKKEINYLKILNPKINQLDDKQLIAISKNSLINELIKEKEILKYTDLNLENKFLNNKINEFISKLELKDIEQLKKKLNENRTYSLDELKRKINIELYWNDFIFFKYQKQIKIDENELIKKINDLETNREEWFLAEIVFKMEINENLQDKIKRIKLDIEKFGFESAANIHSISESSKNGGNLGWIQKVSLSRVLLEELEKISLNNYTNPIKIGNNFIFILKKDKRINKIKVDKQKELQELIQLETNLQLNRFSRIYFDKAKINYLIEYE